MKMPRTPFSTRLSGSAKETELRIRNIFQWKKKRPPVIALIAAVLVVVFCGSLIGFSNTPRNGTLGEVYQAYFAENPTNMIDYENKEAAYPSLALERENFGTALEYVRSMELRSVLGQKKYIGDFNNRNGAVVLRSAAGQELWIDLYRTGYVVVSNEGAGRLDKGADAKVYKVSESFDVEVFLNYLAVEQPEETASEAEVPLYTEELTGLTLDEHGVNDDYVVLTIHQDTNGNQTGQYSLSITFGNGETLTRNFDGYYWFPSLKSARLTSTNKQSVIVELPEFGSTYGAAQYYILEVVDDTLKVFDLNAFYDKRSLLDGAKIVSRPNSELSCLRIPVSAGTKWNNTGWGSLTWDNRQWNFTEDGYFIDTRTLTVDSGMELTLALRGRDDAYGSTGYLYYDQIQILHGETVLQTITEDSFILDNHCPFEYFNADASFHAVLTEDINFDGNTDFGVPCNNTHNDGHVWFLYDPQTRQYLFAFSLAGIPTIDKENMQIMEEWWDDSVYITYNTYEFNADGQLVLIDSEIIYPT